LIHRKPNLQVSEETCLYFYAVSVLCIPKFREGPHCVELGSDLEVILSNPSTLCKKKLTLKKIKDFHNTLESGNA
jgi:hypothetical protein